MRLISLNQVAAAIFAASLTLPVAAWAISDSPPSATPIVATEAASDSSTQAVGTHREKVEQRIADMYATLKITKDQEAQWDTFSQVMLDNAQAIDAMATTKDGSTGTRTAVDSLQGYAEVTEQHAQNVQKLAAAFKPLYAALSVDQQKTADEMFAAKAAEREQKQGAK
jgi:hypothetical protein